MRSVLISLMLTSLISFGQNIPNQSSWKHYEIERCLKYMLANLESDDELLSLLSISDNSKESFIECACDSLEKLYDSYDLAFFDLETMDECQSKTILIDFYFEEYECISGNCLCGFGKQVFADGESYEGDFKITDGESYQGDFKMALFHGNGTYLYKDGSKYEGEFSEHRKHGTGSHFFSDGGSYTGEWRNNVPHGEGLRNWSNGEMYFGDWKNGCRHGNGTYTYGNGGVYNGEWQNNVPHGEGEYTYSDEKYIGNWVNGKRHGKFIIRVTGFNDKQVKYRNGEEVK